MRAALLSPLFAVLLAGCLAEAPDDGQPPPTPAADGGVTTTGPGDSGTPPGSTPDSGTAVTPDAGPLCPSDAGLPVATGTTRELRPGTTLGSLLAASAAGDRILVHAGSYPAESLKANPASAVFIEGAPGEVATFAGLTFTASSQLVLRDLRFTNTLKLDGSHHVLLDGVTIDVGTADTTGLHLHGQGAAGATHDVAVVRSKIWGGARTIFILGRFAPSDTWNHHLDFVGNDFACGTHNCFQISGGRDIRIEDNSFHDPKGDGVLTAGATRVQVLRNRMKGVKSVASTAVRLATPGMEWDNFAGVENMISSEITVANNLISSWGAAGIELDAATDIRIVFNTVADTVGFKTWARVPHSQQGAEILKGNTQVKLWNNILPNVQLDGADPRPVLESNNLVRTGGGGSNLITSDPQYADTTGYALSATSPALDKAMVNELTPAVDLDGLPRGAAPDVGARERGAVSTCP